MSTNLMAFYITATVVILVMLIGFAAGRNKSSRSSVEEWSLGGRKLGSLFVWFLIGADIYTAYTFLGLTSSAFKGGSITFFATPYVVLAYPIAYFFLPKLWKVGKAHSFSTLADYVKGRFESKTLSVLVAIIGVFMLIPYIDLQLSGILDTIKIASNGQINVVLVVIVSFSLVALYTFFSGIKAPTYTAIIKDILVWVIMLYMVVTIPMIHFGSWGSMIETVVAKSPQMLSIPSSNTKGIPWFSTAALVSALALFMWPHTVTGIFSAKSAESLRKNTIILPFYNIVLILVTFLGITASLVVAKGTDPRYVFLILIHQTYGGVMQGLAYSTIALASLVPCSIMAIGASNLFANNIYRDLIAPKASMKTLTGVTRYMVFLVIGLALIFGLIFPNALVSLQLMGVSGIVQIFPVVVFSLFWRNLSKEAAISGLIAGMLTVFLVYASGQTYGLYEGFWGFVVNIVVLGLVNIIYLKKAKIRTNSVMETIFDSKNTIK